MTGLKTGTFKWLVTGKVRTPIILPAILLHSFASVFRCLYLLYWEYVIRFFNKLSDAVLWLQQTFLHRPMRALRTAPGPTRGDTVPAFKVASGTDACIRCLPWHRIQHVGLFTGCCTGPGQRQSSSVWTSRTQFSPHPHWLVTSSSSGQCQGVRFNSLLSPSRIWSAGSRINAVGALCSL